MRSQITEKLKALYTIICGEFSLYSVMCCCNNCCILRSALLRTAWGFNVFFPFICTFTYQWNDLCSCQSLSYIQPRNFRDTSIHLFRTKNQCTRNGRQSVARKVRGGDINQTRNPTHAHGLLYTLYLVLFILQQQTAVEQQ